MAFENDVLNELTVNGVDLSKVKIYGKSGLGAIIEMTPPPFAGPGVTWDPAIIRTGSVATYPGMILESPSEHSAGPRAQLLLVGDYNAGANGSAISGAADNIRFDATDSINIDAQPSGYVYLNNQLLCGSKNGVSGVPGAQVSATKAGAFEDITFATFDFVKKYDTSRVKLSMMATCFTSIATTTLRIGMQINGVDYQVCQLGSQVDTNRSIMSGWNYVPAGLARGTYTVKARWSANGSDFIRMNGVDQLCMEAEEIMP